jgi:hypothetical protein
MKERVFNKYYFLHKTIVYKCGEHNVKIISPSDQIYRNYQRILNNIKYK